MDNAARLELGLRLWGVASQLAGTTRGAALRGGEAQKYLITTRKCGQCARSPTRVTRDATRSSAHCAWTEVRNEQALAHAIRNSIKSARINAFRRSLRRPN